MRILLVTPYYAPDLGPSAPLLTMLSEDLVLLGHQVTVLAAVPHFPSGHVPAEFRKLFWRWSVSEGVRVCRVWVPSGDRSNLGHRLLTFLTFQLLSSMAGLGVHYDVVLVTNPALETLLPFTVLAKLRRRPVVFGVWDLYPEIGVRLGVFSNRTVISIVGGMEDFCLRRANAVQTLSPAFTPSLVFRGVAPGKIVEVLPWMDIDFIRPMPRANTFSAEHGLDAKFVVLYAGNLGLSQGLDNVLQAAGLLATEPEVQFVLIGDGPSKEMLVAASGDLGLTNVLFLPFQPRHRLPEVLATADLSLVSLQQGVGDGSLPSKTFPILASERPILAVVEPNHVLQQLVEESGSGLCVTPGDPLALAQAILSLAKSPDLCRQMGRRGRAYAQRHHSRQAAAKRFEALLASCNQL